MSPAISRRRMLVASALALALATFGNGFSGAFARRRRIPASDAPLAGRLAALLTDREDARAVGRAYLAAHPAEAEPARLLAAFADLDRAPDAGAFGRAFAKVRERDFRAGDIVVVDGWVLARYEARLCALVALS